jgi:hypothetical protein
MNGDAHRSEHGTESRPVVKRKHLDRASAETGEMFHEIECLSFCPAHVCERADNNKNLRTMAHFGRRPNLHGENSFLAR